MSAAQRLSGTDRAAILLILLGETAAGNILKHFPEEDVRRIGDAISRMDEVDDEVGTEVLREYQERVQRTLAVERGGPERARRILARVGHHVTDQSGMEESGENTAEPNPAASLTGIPAPALARILEEESPQAVALLLSHLPPGQAAGVMAQWPEERMAQVALRIGRLQTVDPEVVGQMATVLGERMSEAPVEEEDAGGLDRLGEILGVIDRKVARGLVSELQKTDAELAEAVRMKIFSFDLLLQVDDRGIQEILKQVEQRRLAEALKGADAAITDKILRNMSERAQRMLREEMEYLGTPKVKDVEEAQQEVMQTVARLEEEGADTIEIPEAVTGQGGAAA
ncbi:MAG: flagellar motor switch protein FliG [Acidobacteriota bacterium]